MTPITLIYQTDADDLQRAQTLVHDITRAWRILLILLTAGAAFVLVFEAVSPPRAGDWSWPKYAIFFAVTLGFLYALFLGFLPWANRRQIRRAHERSKGAGLVITSVVSEEGLETRTALAESRHSWECFRKWKASEELILIFQTDVLFNMLPRRAFASQADFDAVREFLTRRLGPPK